MATKVRSSVQAAAVALCVCLSAPSPSRADNCMADIWDNGSLQGGGVLFPNWNLVHVGSYDVWLYDTNLSPEEIVGLTIANFGTADNNDIRNVYWRASCWSSSSKSAVDSGYVPMTYAGIYQAFEGAPSSHPAWTWAGTSPDFSVCDDLCGNPPCGAYFTIDVFADIEACPTDGKTVWLGFPVNETTNTTWWGSMWGSGGCALPWYSVSGQLPYEIYRAYKVGPKDAIPGDTITFTIYYGRAGSTDLSGIVVTDSLPPYTHYVQGSATPAPDPAFDPDPGPPPRVRWTFPGPIPVAGGATGQIVFDVSVDWGNGESFEPGSGDVAAPEGIRLKNRVHVNFENASCQHFVTPPVTTAVRRFLFWKLGDNDMLFSSSLGQPPDEMIYSIFLRNLSSTKTWWDVNIWDTVPSELDVWGPDCGFSDPCLGWTMTPSGCSPAYPNRTVSAGNTILKWTLDMPPGKTLELRWKARVKGSTPPDSLASNVVSLKAMGKTGIVNGTGSSVTVKNFTHQARIMLPTTYISYVAYAAGTTQKGSGFIIDFFPLNKKTQFSLHGIFYDGGQAFANTGGVSDSIGCLIGDCIGGFPGNSGCSLGQGAIPGGGIAGCKAERIPALYDPEWPGLSSQFNLVFKVTANSPAVWQMLTHIDNCNQDRHTYAPGTNLTYTAFMHYTWPGDFTAGTSFTMVNTGMNPDRVFDPDLATTVHLFTFDYSVLQWAYDRTFEIGPQGQATCLLRGPDTFPATSPDYRPWRFASSDASLIINVGNYSLNTAGCCCCSGADNFGAFAPTRETGLVVSAAGSAHFYGLTQPTGCDSRRGVAIIGNVSGGIMAPAAADYEIFIYTPNSTLGAANIPPLLRDTGGTWRSVLTGTVPPGLADPGNAAVFCVAPFNQGSSNLFRIEQKNGGPLQINHGTDPFSQWGGGAVMHAADGRPMGTEYWLHHAPGNGSNYCVDVFCSKTGTVVRMVSEDGYDSTYTTNGPDQCVKFMALTNPGVACETRNYMITASGGSVITLYSQHTPTEKGYTAPFLETGVHYNIITPPVAFIGQEFWITVVVLETGYVTKEDYTGTTSFTSTDPGAMIEGSPMDSYDYTWTGSGGDDGVRIFFKVTLNDLGFQTIVGTDTTDGSIVGLAAVLVVGADVKLFKEERLTVAASGDVVQFKICWSNYSSATADGFTITDAIPNGTTYVQDTAANHFIAATYGFAGATVAYSTTDDSPGAFQPMPAGGTSDPVAWLRWTIPQIGVNTTGCVGLKVRVN